MPKCTVFDLVQTPSTLPVNQTLNTLDLTDSYLYRTVLHFTVLTRGGPVEFRYWSMHRFGTIPSQPHLAKEHAHADAHNVTFPLIFRQRKLWKGAKIQFMRKMSHLDLAQKASK